MSKYLIRSENLFFHIPTFKPSEQKLTANPLRVMSSFYINKTGRETVTLLSDLTFSLKRGERLGLIGKNGAGKTTLLRMLCGIYRPSSGSLEIDGTAQGLFNVQLGMNDGATGIENIYLRGLQMGLRLSQIRMLVEEVVEFADIGGAINDVFGNYSTGMRLRLAIAISTMMEPDILIMDEWIGAGDAAFREKINVRMKTLIGESRGLVIATHSVELMKSICTHGMVLHHGKCEFYGPVNEALSFYKKEIVAK